jgi:hypothetical protein
VYLFLVDISYTSGYDCSKISPIQLSCQNNVLLPLPTAKLVEHAKIPFNFDMFLQNVDVVPLSHGLYAIPAPEVTSFHQLSVVSYDHIHFIKSDWFIASKFLIPKSPLIFFHGHYFPINQK